MFYNKLLINNVDSVQNLMAELENVYAFPNPEDSDKEGLVAVGGDLSPSCLLAAYREGIFPWFNEDYPILWWSPDPRLILLPNEFKRSDSFKKTLKQANFHYTFDSAFKQVIYACATVKGRQHETWITKGMQEAYITLHELGFAHSVEVWSDHQLIGGLYGISLGRAFFGESMFHLKKDASKIALYCLCQQLKDWQFDFIDCQLPTPHLQRLGAKPISRHEFLDKLKCALNHPTRQGLWQ